MITPKNMADALACSKQYKYGPRLEHVMKLREAAITKEVEAVSAMRLYVEAAEEFCCTWIRYVDFVLVGDRIECLEKDPTWKYGAEYAGCKYSQYTGEVMVQAHALKRDGTRSARSKLYGPYNIGSFAERQKRWRSSK